MGYIGASADTAIGFSDGGLLIGLGADIGKRYHLILLIGSHQILIHHLTDLDILAILSLCLTLTILKCTHLDLDLIIQHILIRGHLLRMLYLFTTQ